MAVFAVLCQPHPVSRAALLYSYQLWRVTAGLVSCRLKEINGFFARNNEEYLALIFEKEGSYLGREVSCPQGPCYSWVSVGESPVSSGAGASASSRVSATGTP